MMAPAMEPDVALHDTFISGCLLPSNKQSGRKDNGAPMLSAHTPGVLNREVIYCNRTGCVALGSCNELLRQP